MSVEISKPSSGKQSKIASEILLDGPLTILYEMVRLTQKGERIWFGKLVENLKDKRTSEGIADGKLILHSMNTLSDGRIIERYTGETKRGYAGFLWRITNSWLENAKTGYNEYMEAIGAPKLKISEHAALKADKRREEYAESRYVIARLKKGLRI